MLTSRVAERSHGLVVDLTTTTEGTEKAPVHVSVLAVGPAGGPSHLHAEVARVPGLTARRVRGVSESLAHQAALDALPQFLADRPAVTSRILGKAA